MKKLIDAGKAPATRGLTIALADGDLISLEFATGWRIVCRRGLLWLSTAGKRGQPGTDIELRRDECSLIDSPRKVLIEAAGNATLDLIAPLPTLIPGKRGDARVIRVARQLAPNHSGGLLRAPPTLESFSAISP